MTDHAPTPPHGQTGSPNPAAQQAGQHSYGWTAPSSRPVDPTPAGGISIENPSDILDELASIVPGARGALLASVDGFAVARSASMPNEAAHAAMLAAALGLGRQLVGIGNGAELRQLVVEHDGGLLLLWPIGTVRVLAVHAATSVDQVMLRSFVRARAAHLGPRSS